MEELILSVRMMQDQEWNSRNKGTQMNILLTTDDGPQATGLQVLREATAKAFPSARLSVITTEQPRPGCSMSVTPGWETWKTAKANKIAEREWSIDLTPSDLIYRAFMQRDEFTNRDWELVLVGVNHGQNLGFDIYHSGTTGAAMVASAAFGCPAFAFSQEMADTDLFHEAKVPRTLFRTADQVLSDYLRKQAPDMGTCYNINFPILPPKGYKDCRPAHYSRFRTPPTAMVPRARNESSDITLLNEGWVTVSELVLRTAAAQKY